MRCRGFIALLVAVPLLAAAATEAGRYLETSEYLAGTFPAGTPQPRTLWLAGDLREQVDAALGHRFGSLRVRYWYDGDTSAWVLDEVGKEMPITIGVSVGDDGIRSVRILEFRESRGWEVRYPFFTDQFHGARLAEQSRLDRDIDGITGATLSVRAVTKIAQVALLLHDEIRTEQR